MQTKALHTPSACEEQWWPLTPDLIRYRYIYVICMWGLVFVTHWGLWFTNSFNRLETVYCSQKFGRAPLNQHNKYLTTLSCCQSQWLAVMARSKTCTQTSCNWARKKTKNTLTAAKKRNLNHKSHSIMKIVQTTLEKKIKNIHGMCGALGCTGETMAACVLPKTKTISFHSLSLEVQKLFSDLNETGLRYFII